MTGRLRVTASLSAALLGVLVGSSSVAQRAEAPQPKPSTLRAAESFRSIQDEAERSLALFEEAGKVITHPRCVNCHPRSDRPLQGETGRPHQPAVFATESGMGSPSLPCTACHGQSNFTLPGTRVGSMPGHPRWHLAPREMAWEGQSLGSICRQIKDPARNGGKDLAALHEHMAKDDLVGWGWTPGVGRQPAPGTQEVFGELIKAWIDAGAVCPS